MASVQEQFDQQVPPGSDERRQWEATYGPHAAAYIWADQANVAQLPEGFRSLSPGEMETWFSQYGDQAPQIWQQQSTSNTATNSGPLKDYTNSQNATAANVPQFGGNNQQQSQPTWGTGAPKDMNWVYDVTGGQTGHGTPVRRGPGSNWQNQAIPDSDQSSGAQFARGSVTSPYGNMFDTKKAFHWDTNMPDIADAFGRSDTPSGLSAGTEHYAPDNEQALLNHIKNSEVKITSANGAQVAYALSKKYGINLPSTAYQGIEGFNPSSLGMGVDTNGKTTSGASASSGSQAPNTAGALDAKVNITPSSSYIAQRPGDAPFDVPSLVPDKYGISKFKYGTGGGIPQFGHPVSYGVGGAGDTTTAAAIDTSGGPSTLDPDVMNSLANRMSMAADAAIKYSQALGYIVQPKFDANTGTWTYEPVKDANGANITYGGASQDSQIREAAARTALLQAQTSGRFQDANGNWQQTPDSILKISQAAGIQNDANLAWAKLTGTTANGQSTLDKQNIDAQIRQKDTDLQQHQQLLDDAKRSGDLDRQQKEEQFISQLQLDKDKLTQQSNEFATTQTGYYNGQTTLAQQQQTFNQQKDIAALASNPRNYLQASMLGNARGGLAGQPANNQVQQTTGVSDRGMSIMPAAVSPDMSGASGSGQVSALDTLRQMQSQLDSNPQYQQLQQQYAAAGQSGDQSAITQLRGQLDAMTAPLRQYQQANNAALQQQSSAESANWSAPRVGSTVNQQQGDEAGPANQGLTTDRKQTGRAMLSTGDYSGAGFFSKQVMPTTQAGQQAMQGQDQKNPEYQSSYVNARDKFMTAELPGGGKLHFYDSPQGNATTPVAAATRALMQGTSIPSFGGIQADGGYVNQKELTDNFNPTKINPYDYGRARPSEQQQTNAVASLSGYSDEDFQNALDANRMKRGQMSGGVGGGTPPPFGGIGATPDAATGMQPGPSSPLPSPLPSGPPPSAGIGNARMKELVIAIEGLLSSGVPLPQVVSQFANIPGGADALTSLGLPTNSAETTPAQPGSGGGIKLTGVFDGKSNKLGYGGRAAQLTAQGVPGGVIGMLARRAKAAPGQINFHN